MAKINLYNHQPYPRKVHRWGWNAVSQLIIENFHDEKAPVMLDSLIEHTYRVGRDKRMNFSIFPHMKQKWIGMFHNPPYGNGPSLGSLWEYNIFNLYLDREFRGFMDNCIGLISMSKYWALKTAELFKTTSFDVPVGFIHHPSGECDEKFNPDNFKRQVIHVGFWMRNFESFFRLKTKYKKKLLQGPGSYGTQPYYLSRKKIKTRHEYQPYETIGYLNNNEYDDIMSSSIVFLDLFESTANNVVVECITRQTPVLVNPNDSIMEYLGKDYPYYYFSLDEASEKLEDEELMLETSDYLKSRQFLVSEKKFIKDLGHILNAWLD